MDVDNKCIRAFVSNVVVFPDETCQAVIQVKNSKIHSIQRHSTDVSAFTEDQVVDCGDLVLMSGLVDSHVHINEPGRTAWEGFSSATQAAAAGGITTLVDMPLNCIPATTSVKAWEVKMAAAESRCWVDVGFWGGVVPGNSAELLKMVAHGICGFKCFLVNSGVDEFPCVTFDDVREALQELVGSKSILLFHAECEIEDTISDEDPPGRYSTFLKSRPQKMEALAIQRIISLCEETKVRCHIVHLSGSKNLPMIRRAQERGVPLSVETCYHYLTLSAEEIPDHATQYKCCPPIREAENQCQLWEALRDGTIQQVVSDHSPCTPDLKQPGKMNFKDAWGGISSLQFGLSVFWTGAQARGFTLQDVVKCMSLAPATQASLQQRKGALRVGLDADFVIWDPTETFTINESMILHRNKLTPYLGKTVRGKVYKTVLRGNVIYDRGNFCTAVPRGKFVFAPNLI
ncbi:allantoinase [Cherax quadricarinatus]|uniref:allantoinase n=1 Tax=Cherax quadricarinatus TaxID=27406 RepID=UPI0023787364|nr:allantoinase-like [Cherax quadricarinatus]XP_053633610.1 allantoinase-like [Cherax quadricarinatus]